MGYWIDAIDGIITLWLATIAEEVQVEAGRLVLRRAKEGHSHDVFVEFQTDILVFDSNHGVIHAVCGYIRFLHILGFVHRILRDDLNPVLIWAGNMVRFMKNVIS